MSTSLSDPLILRSLILATENWEQRIQDASKESPKWFVAQVPRETAELGAGYTRTYYKFHRDILDQSGFASKGWKQVLRGRAAGTGYTKPDGTVVPPNEDPGLDPCSWVAETMGYGFEPKNYNAWSKAIMSHELCADQVKYDWQYVQQIDYIFSAMPEHSMQVWENAFRSYFMHMAGKYVLAGGDPQSVTFTQDVTSETADTTITIASKPSLISAFNWNAQPKIHQRLLFDAGSRAAMGMKGAMPQYMIVMDYDDFDAWIRRDADVREDIRYSGMVEVLIDGWPYPVQAYRNFLVTFYPQMPRYKVLTEGAVGAAMTLKQVEPYVSEATTYGTKKVTSDEYQRAQYSEFWVVPKAPFTVQIPPAIKTAGGGTVFDNVPSLSGDFQFIQSAQHWENNPKRNKGRYFATFEAFFKDGVWGEYAGRYLYRRDVGVVATLNDTYGTDTGTGAITILSGEADNVPTNEGDAAPATSTQVDVTLEEALPCEFGPVTVTYAGPTTATGYIAISFGGNKYRLTMASAADWATNLGTGSATVACDSAAH